MALVPAAAFGTVVKLDTVALGGVISLSGPGVTIDTIDVTSHSSTSGYREFVEGLADGGELTMEIIFDDANELVLATKRAAGLTVTIEITWPGAIVWSAEAWLTGIEPNAASDGALTATVTWKITGVITYDP